MRKCSKSLFLILLATLILLTACDCAQLVESTFEEKVPIYVNGELLQNGKAALISDGFIKIPFVSVFETLGASVNWESDTKATITYNSETYILDTENLKLYNSNRRYNTNLYGLDEGNYLFGINGGSYILYAQNKEVIIDSRTLTLILESLEVDVIVKYDRTSNLVSINKQ